MGLSELPLEIQQEILNHAVNVRGIKRALRLRLVNSLFSEEVKKALFNSHILEEFVQQDKVKGGFGPWQNRFWQSYLVYKIIRNRDSLPPRQQIVYDIAQRLGDQTGNNSSDSIREILWALCARPYPILKPYSFVRKQRNDTRYLLQAAIITECVTVVQRILSASNTSSEILDNTGRDIWLPPLRLAGRSGNLKILEALLSTTRYRPRDEMREEALSGAVSFGHLEAIKFIMDPRWGPINFFSSSHSVVEHLSSGVVRSNLPDFCQQLFALFKARSTIRYPIEIESPGMNSQLDHVARDPRERDDVVEYLLDQGCTLQELDCPMRNRLRYSYIPPNSRTNSVRGYYEAPLPYNPLRRAVKGCNEKVVRLLLKRGADPNAVDDDVLYCAVRTGCLETVRLLVEHGADVNRLPGWDVDCQKYQKLRPPIVEALLLEHEQMARYLHERGAMLPIPELEDRSKDCLGRQRAEEEGMESVIKLSDRLIRCQMGVRWCAGECPWKLV